MGGYGYGLKVGEGMPSILDPLRQKAGDWDMILEIGRQLLGRPLLDLYRDAIQQGYCMFLSGVNVITQHIQSMCDGNTEVKCKEKYDVT